MIFYSPQNILHHVGTPKGFARTSITAFLLKGGSVTDRTCWGRICAATGYACCYCIRESLLPNNYQKEILQSDNGNSGKSASTQKGQLYVPCLKFTKLSAAV